MEWYSVWLDSVVASSSGSFMQPFITSQWNSVHMQCTCTCVWHSNCWNPMHSAVAVSCCPCFEYTILVACSHHVNLSRGWRSLCDAVVCCSHTLYIGHLSWHVYKMNIHKEIVSGCNALWSRDLFQYTRATFISLIWVSQQTPTWSCCDLFSHVKHGNRQKAVTVNRQHWQSIRYMNKYWYQRLLHWVDIHVSADSPTCYGTRMSFTLCWTFFTSSQSLCTGWWVFLSQLCLCWYKYDYWCVSTVDEIMIIEWVGPSSCVACCRPHACMCTQCKRSPAIVLLTGATPSPVIDHQLVLLALFHHCAWESGQKRG